MSDMAWNIVIVSVVVATLVVLGYLIYRLDQY